MSNIMLNKRLEVFNSGEFGELKTVAIDNEVYFVANEVSLKLGYGDGNIKSKAVKNAIVDHVDKEDQMMLKHADAKEVFRGYCGDDPNFKINSNGIKLINVKGLLDLIRKSRTVTEQYKEDFISFLQNNKIIDKNLIVLSSRKEIEFIDTLEKVLEPFGYECKRQHGVSNYKIDFYIKDLNIAIEYDENGHKDYSYEKQEERQSIIEKELNCKFIRVSDKDSNLWNIGYIMKNLMNCEVR